MTPREEKTLLEKRVQMHYGGCWRLNKTVIELFPGGVLLPARSVVVSKRFPGLRVWPMG